ncbi:Uncharacterized protein Adt_30798 [Abeliophyllum distichum]|uniref:Aminotransferase-like plant mobile domain-containing protein n=1 Tax=Abeliophyllum distichum TaxID=126358 RepID=A0ABD1RCA1_9LAMI
MLENNLIELASLEVDCIEQYLPNRVAMQFGMDQDLPGFVARVNGSFEIAWSNYTRPTGDAILYIPARIFESDVTTRYLQWWDKLKFAGSGMTKAGLDGKKYLQSLPRKDAPRKNTLASANTETKAVFHGHGSSERSKRKTMESLPGNKSDKDAHVPPPLSFGPKHTRVEAGDSGVKDNKTRVVVTNRTKGHDKSCSQTENEAPGMGLEERICIIEKGVQFLDPVSLFSHDYSDVLTRQSQSNDANRIGLIFWEISVISDVMLVMLDIEVLLHDIVQENQ